MISYKKSTNLFKTAILLALISFSKTWSHPTTQQRVLEAGDPQINSNQQQQPPPTHTPSQAYQDNHNKPKNKTSLLLFIPFLIIAAFAFYLIFKILRSSPVWNLLKKKWKSLKSLLIKKKQDPATALQKSDPQSKAIDFFVNLRSEENQQ